MPQQTVVSKAPPKIGDYQILSKIGQGGIAEVYKALQTSLQREVAIKILSSGLIRDSEIVKRFERESLLIGRLNHPNIVHVIDKGIQGNRYYFVMEYVNGYDFKVVINNANITLEVKMEMLVQVCKAIDFAHKNGVIHRDIKPANILIDRQGNAMVADFGIAQLRDKTDIEVTSSDVIMGTVAYMSPEQKFSSANVTGASDIYSLGIILYEICCGKKPQGHFKMPSQLNPKVPAAVDAIVMKCLEENPGDRYETAGALKDALLNAFAGQLQNSGSAGETIARVESFMGKCRFLDTIREDRFGATYLVENGETKKLYIIKKKKSGAGLKEARILSSLKHKNIANILGAGGDSKKTVIVTEYVQGGSLADRPGRTYDWQEAMEIIVQIAEGLNFAHINNLRHGNLRPSNILFAADDVIKLTDFGFPPHYDSQKDWYAPPEKKQTRQGDMFSLGVILFMLMTNKIPQHDRAGNPYLGKLETKIPKKIQEILRRLLQIRAVKRYQSLEEMLVEYSEYLEVKNAPRVKVAAVPRPGKKKNYMPLILAGAAIILGAMLALYWDKLIGG